MNVTRNFEVSSPWIGTRGKKEECDLKKIKNLR